MICYSADFRARKGQGKGQRQGDLLRAAWTNYDGKALRVRQSKGNVLVRIPCTKALRAMLDDMPRAAPIMLTSATGKGLEEALLLGPVEGS